MLTDIFADRYSNVPLWQSFSEADRRFLVQGYRMVESLFPYYYDGKIIEANKQVWKSIHDKLSMELGVTELSRKAYSYQSTINGKAQTVSGLWEYDYICQNFVCADFDERTFADRFVKERISFIEIAFRERNDQIKYQNSTYQDRLQKAEIADKLRKPDRLSAVLGNHADSLKLSHELMNSAFSQHVEELNERMRRAGYKLNYHNGYIQLSDDELVSDNIEKHFWALTSDPLWVNVDIDMKEAIDRRDGGGKDPAFYAARALESTIKIISDQKKFTHGGEKGAHSYIENLASKSNRYIAQWESNALKSFFTEVRNPLGHGAGSSDMPSLGSQQTSWAIESAMSWIKSLITRL